MSPVAGRCTREEDVVIHRLTRRLLPAASLLAAALLAAGCQSDRRGRTESPPDEDEGGPCRAGEVLWSGGRAMVCEPDGALTESEDCLAAGRVCEPGVGCIRTGGRDAGPGENDSRLDAGGPAEDVPPPADVVEGGSCNSGDKGCVESRQYYCAGGTWVLLEDCGEQGRECVGGECVGCEPGEVTCQGRSVVRCAEDGVTEEVVEVCGEGSTCRDGACVSACGVEDAKVSYQGCEYWAVDLDNADVALLGDQDLSPRHAQFAVAISNVSRGQTAQVRVYESDGVGEEQVGPVHEVAPESLEVIELPARNVVGSTKGFFAYRIATSLPVIAYQFNPLNNTEAAFSNDASLLLPTNALDREYLAVTGDGIRGKDLDDNRFEWGAFVTIVGVASQPTEVTVDLPGDFLPPPGADVGLRTVTASLSRYEVLSITSRLGMTLWPENGQGNLSGARVRADGPVAVFAGNIASPMPVQPGGRCCADHLEEQLFPTSSWGRSFVAPRSLVRRPGDPEPDYWRLTASVDGTQIQYTPARPPGAPTSLDAGDSVEFHALSHFLLEATEPVLLTQFLSSSQNVMADPSELRTCEVGPEADAWCTEQEGHLAACRPGEERDTCQPISDPSMLLVPPTEQFREDYLFLTPLDYALDFVNVMAPAGTEVRLDGEPLDGFSDVGELSGTPWRVATVEVPDGTHRLEATRAVGLMVYGYDLFVSYGYPGGLNLERINVD